MALPKLISLRKSEHQTTTKQLKPDIQPMYIYKQFLPSTFPAFHTKLPTPAELKTSKSPRQIARSCEAHRNSCDYYPLGGVSRTCSPET